MSLRTVSNSQLLSSSIASWTHGRSPYIFALTTITATGLCYFAKDIGNYLLDRAYLWITTKNDPQALQLLQEAKRTSDEGKIDHALQLNASTEVIALLWEGKAELALARQDYAQAIEATEQALSFTQKKELKASIYFTKAQACELLGRSHEALGQIYLGLEFALDQQNNLKAQMHLLSAKICQGLGRNDLFIIRTEKALFCNPSDLIKAEVWLLRGQDLKAHRQHENALRFLRTASRFNLPPNHPIGAEIATAIRDVTRAINAKKELGPSKKQSRRAPTS